MPWHIQMGPIMKGCAVTSWIMKHSTETNHGRQDDLRGNTGTRCGTCTGARKWPGGSFNPSYQGLQSLLLLMSCKTEQIRLDTPISRCFLHLLLWVDFLYHAYWSREEAYPATLKSWQIPLITQYKWGGLGWWEMKKWLMTVPTFPVCCIHRGKKRRGEGLISIWTYNFFT